MITIGVDAHKRVHMAVALDERGQAVARWRGANSVTGWEALAQWAAALGAPAHWGSEGAWNDGRELAQSLVAVGATVYEVNPRWTAAGRRQARRSGKNDRLDAHAVAVLVWREGTSLPVVIADDETATLNLLVTERESLVAEATRLRDQIHHLLLHLDPEYARHLPTLRTQNGLQALERYVTTEPSPTQRHRAAAVRRLAQRLRLALAQADTLAEEIRLLAATRFTPLTMICGVDLLSAGAIAGILGPGHRFANDAQLAAYAGVAPLEASSAERVRHRVNRGGNRRLNAILYRIAVTQARCSPPARDYLERRTQEGKTRREALRALKRYIVRVIWRQWQHCHPAGVGETAALAV